MVTSQNGINLIKSFEGCRLTAYQDSVGVWTIGYGHTGNVTPGMTITQAQCDKFLASDLARFEKNVEKFNSTYAWTQNEFDALVSFAYNVGSINGLTANGTRSKTEISNKILLYNKAGGKELAGLTRRRKAEREMFLGTSSSSSVKTESASSQSTTASSSTSYTQKQFIKDVQKILGTTVDGIAGPKTLGVTITVSKFTNRTHAVVVPIQKYLKQLGYYTGKVDGIFGGQSTTAVINYQKKFLSKPDGIISKSGYTWRKMLGMLK